MTGFWRTVSLLLRAARARAHGRSDHQRKLMGRRGSSSGGGTAVLATLLAAAIHGVMGGMLGGILEAGDSARAEQAGRVLVSSRSYDYLIYIESRPDPGQPLTAADDTLRQAFRGEGRRSAADDEAAYELSLAQRFRRLGRAGFESAMPSTPIADMAERLPPASSWLGSLLVVLWFLCLAFQGEGVDLDMQQRRHPLIEWLFSHPVRPSAVFLSELLAPLAANPMYWMAPLFWIVLFSSAYGNVGIGIYAGLAAGLPLAAAAGCSGKALEIFAQFRLPPRTRGALLGLLGWVGYTSMAAMLVLASSEPFVHSLAGLLGRVSSQLSLPLLRYMLGLGAQSSAWRGVVVCVCSALVIMVCATLACVRATQRGLAGAFADVSTPVAAKGGIRLRDPMLRKELLWLRRDRGALVQVFLIPLSVIGIQLLNFQRSMRHMTWSWNVVAGVVVLFGAYFIQVLGPRSLTSEGSALWIAQTWPRGLDSMLKAKGRLWWLITQLIVLPVLLVAALYHPADAWKLLLVALVWAIHGAHLSERAVTLVRVPSSSGELEPLPRSKQWAASMGTLVVGVGLLSSQWTMVLTGVIYSWLVAAAQWQSFRAHVPYLFDPWSEELPPAPTLSQAMLACYGIFELTVVLTAVFASMAGTERLMFARGLAYAGSTVIGGLITHGVLHNRGVTLADIVRFGTARARFARVALFALAAIALGAGLGLGARQYLMLLQHVPQLAEILRKASEAMSSDPAEHTALLIMAVVFAPLAEEYLFRGLLFRALQREWGSARAIWGSALFFAIFHPMLAWPPVALVGAASAWLLAQGKHLLPCVLLHMTYNAVVLWQP